MMSENLANVRSLTINGCGSIVIQNDGIVTGGIQFYEYHPEDGILFIESKLTDNQPLTYSLNDGVVDIKMPLGMKLRVNGCFVDVPFPEQQKAVRLVDASITSIVCNGSVSLGIESLYVLNQKALQINTHESSKVTLPAQSLESLIIFAHEESSVKGECIIRLSKTVVDRLIVRAEGRSTVSDFGVQTRLILTAVDWSNVHSLRCSTALRTVNQSAFASVKLEIENE